MLRTILRQFHADPYGDLFHQDTRRRLTKLLSPRYALDKLALVAFENRHPDLPWITRNSIEYLESYLRPTHLAFEWGSGTGTAWFARRVRRIISIEHNRAWHSRVNDTLAAQGLGNAELRFVPETAYTDQIDTFPNEVFDLILVDGLFRDVAFLRSIPKVKPGGWIVFDNVNWYLPSTSRTPQSRSMADGPATPLYAQVMQRVSDWHCVWTTNGVNDTAIFVKPVRKPI